MTMPGVDPSVELHDEGPEDDELVVIAWLRPLLPDGQIANARPLDAPLPFIVVNHLESNDSVDMGWSDDLISVHCLYPKGNGNANRKAAAKFAADVHRRMLLLAVYHEPVQIGARVADVDYCDVAMRPRWEPYGDEQILRKIARYRMGLGYVKLS